MSTSRPAGLLNPEDRPKFLFVLVVFAAVRVVLALRVWTPSPFCWMEPVPTISRVLRMVLPRSRSSTMELPWPLTSLLVSSGSSTMRIRAEVDLTSEGLFEATNLISPPG